ncbi:MAG: NTP transferase domain-containing protein [Actinomycetota bacterium]|nr:NTP transferase domain-containing protein [Actinomycetota bacterium]MDA8358054.1 NTP transferase domain-containing protein [Actinomycetota bacterium]
MNLRTSQADRPRATLVVLAAGRATRYGGIKPLAPVGLAGEAVLDLLASDALAAGFDRLVLVVGPESGPAIRYHVERTWPGAVPVEFARQESPRGTVDAVLAAAPQLGDGSPFGVANADDLPGVEGLALLAGHLRRSEPVNAAVCYRLRASLLGDAPVTRGLCRVDAEDMLETVEERRHVTPLPDGRIVAGDGHEPKELDPDQLVSMNLWGFTAEMLGLLEAAADFAQGGEVLLPEVVDRLLAQRRESSAGAAEVKVLRASGRCIGVTHAADVPLVQAELAREVGRGERPAQLWSSEPVVGQ